MEDGRDEPFYTNRSVRAETSHHPNVTAYLEICSSTPNTLSQYYHGAWPDSHVVLDLDSPRALRECVHPIYQQPRHTVVAQLPRYDPRFLPLQLSGVVKHVVCACIEADHVVSGLQEAHFGILGSTT
jgi:hypothetical protein